MKFLSCFRFLLAFMPTLVFAQNTPHANLVNPFIGTGGHGHTFPGPVVPFGMVQVGPDTRIDGSWDGCGGYHYDDTLIYGFSHTHLSGTGCSDLGDVMLIPTTAGVSFDPKVYASKFDHKQEKASSGYYQVNLSDNNINVELTASTRVGLHKYTFPNKGTYQIILDLHHRDKLLQGAIEKVSSRAITGYRNSDAWAKNQRLFYRIEFSKDIKSITYNEDKTKAAFVFDLKKGEVLYTKVSISAVDQEGANKNMAQEMPDFNFEKVKKEAELLWEKELSKIITEGGTPEQRTVFYTALYHCFIHPSIYNDVDGRYLGRDMQIHQADGFNYYTIFSLWDTFRALHPLFNLVQRERNADFIKTFLVQYQHAGRMPMWELWSNETDCMIGYHSVSIIADALAKGNNNFDKNLAAEACAKTSTFNHYGVPIFKNQGYLTVENEHESVSKSLEYAYGDWCYERVLQLLNNTQQAKPKYPGNLSWQMVFNEQNGFMQPRSNGGWYQPFIAKEVNNNYTEANAWQYSFFVPQNIAGLIAAHGGKAAFEAKLDELFTTGSKTEGRNQADISGLIGQYAHGNEPSHHMAYLYNYVGKPQKTRALVSRILREMYANAPDGLAGNEDCGQMSAWYVFSAMGFYPVTPGLNEYQAGTGILSKVRLSDNNNVIEVKNTFNKSLDSLAIPESIKKIIPIETGPEITEPTAKGILPYPILISASKSFGDSLLIEAKLGSIQKQSTPILIKIEGDSGKWVKDFTYTKPFYIYQNAKVSASVQTEINGEKTSLNCMGKFYKRPNNWTIKTRTPYNNQYTAGGPGALVDGMFGDADWRKGGWQGYWGQDLVAEIDLGQTKTINEFFGDFLQDQRAWIVLPKKVLFYTSEDGINYTLQGESGHDTPWQVMEALTKTISFKPNTPIKARYVKVVAQNYGKLPAGHLSPGEDAYVFVDEIGVR
jgi:predicted alpha-1,2-mannosidase